MSEGAQDQKQEKSEPVVTFKKRKDKNASVQKKRKAESGQKEPVALPVSGPAPAPAPAPEDDEQSVAVSEERIEDEQKRDDDDISGKDLVQRLKKRRLEKEKLNPNVATTSKPKEKTIEPQYSSSRTVISSSDPHIAIDTSQDKTIRTEATKDVPKWKLGPLKAPSNVRAYSRMDYQPDVCKDYKETGYCGYGDNCKFMHDRGDYKSGWQLEREWQQQEELKKKKLLGEIVEDETNYEIKEEDDFPWKCIICREDFKNPVATKCMHYFCEACALTHYTKDTKCFACGEQTSGIFNTAHKLIRSIELRKKAEAQEEEAVPAVQPKVEAQQGWAFQSASSALK